MRFMPDKVLVSEVFPREPLRVPPREPLRKVWAEAALPLSGPPDIFGFGVVASTRSTHPLDSVEKEARKALNRLRRALEKSARELQSLESAIRHAEGEDFPAEEYDSVGERLRMIMDFLDEEGRRLEEKILETGGLEPGRVRRSSS
jgi:hypothetical protein